MPSLGDWIISVGQRWERNIGILILKGISLCENSRDKQVSSQLYLECYPLKKNQTYQGLWVVERLPYWPAREFSVSWVRAGASESCGYSRSRVSVFTMSICSHSNGWDTPSDLWEGKFVLNEELKPFITGTKLPAVLCKGLYLCHTGQKTCPALVLRGIHLLFPKWRQSHSFLWTLEESHSIFQGSPLYKCLGKDSLE